MENKSKKSPRHSKRRRLRCAIITLLILAAIATTAFFALTRGPIARKIVLAQLTNLTDAKVNIKSATIALDGTITITDLSLTSNTLPDTPGEVFYAQTATITLDGLLTGSPTPTAITIENPVIRLSQDTKTGELNINTIHLMDTGSSGGPLPAVTITGGILELGEYTAADYHRLRRLPIAATLAEGAAPDSYIFTLEQNSPDEPPFQLVGTILPDRTEITIDELDLAAWPNDAIPSRLRNLHRRLGLKGKILPTSLTISRTGQLEMLMQLEGVDLQLPIEQAPLARGHMTDVNGTLRIDPAGVHAELNGLLDEVPATASLHAQKLDPNSPFTCEIHIGRVRLADNINRLGYIPEFVREQLEIFSNPTAEIALDLELTRPENSAEVIATGFMYLYDGVASYRDFPYEFTNLEATFELAQDTLYIRKVSGGAPSGAHIEATGKISPLGPIAEAKIDITVTKVPLDPRLRTALGKDYEELFDTLLSRTRYRELQALSLIQTPRQKRERTADLEKLRTQEPTPENTQRITELESQIQIPAFNLGGRSTVEINIFRHLGEENIWDTNIVVKIPRAGFLPEQFPLPIIAKDVTLHIIDNKATLKKTDGLFHTLAGGSATVAADAVLTDHESFPTITIEATDIPVTPLLINAIPGNPETDSADAHALLTAMGLEGTIDCTAKIGHPDLPIFQIEVHPRAVTARIDDWLPKSGTLVTGLALADITGRILAKPDTLELDLNTRITNAQTSESIEPPLARLKASVNYGQNIPEKIRIRSLDATIEKLPLTTPIEQLIALVNEPAAEQLLNLRTQYKPSGTVDVVLTQEIDKNNPEPLTHLAISNAHDLTIAFKDANLTLTESTGQIILTRGKASGISFDHFSGPTLYDGQPLGLADINGSMRPAATDQPDLESPPDHIFASLTDCTYNASLVDRLIPDKADKLRSLLQETQPEAIFDLEADIAIAPDRAISLASLKIKPRTISLTRDQTRINLNIVSGTVSIEDSAAYFDHIEAESEFFSATMNGRIDAIDPDSIDADLGFTLDAPSLTPQLKAAIPPQLKTIIDQLSIAIDSPLSLSGGHLLFSRRPDTNRLDLLGHLEVQNASANAGVEIEKMNAALDFVFHTDAVLETPDFEIRIDAKEFIANKIWMTNGSFTVRSTIDQAIQVAPILADVHGGKIAASAVIWQGQDQTTRYDFETTLSGVRFAPILRDLTLDTTPPDPDSTADESRGVIDARLTMFGLIDGPRRGVGHIQVSQGKVLKLPLLVPLIEVGNLRPPTGEQLELARAQFYLHDDQVTFEELSVLSKSIELIGYGTMSLETRQLDLRFNSRANSGIPLLSPIFEGIRDELITIRVKGTLQDPALSMQQLTTTRAAIASLLGRPQTEQEKLLREIKRRALRFRERSRMSSQQVQSAIENIKQQGNNQDQ
jgi:hypothetical protein